MSHYNEGRTMTARHFVGTDKPLELNEVPKPTADPGQGVIDDQSRR